MLPDISFVRGVKTNGQPLPGTDYISGAIFYKSALPPGFPSSGFKKCFSLADAESVGITNTHIGETKATSDIQILTTGAQGDQIPVIVNEPNGPVTIGVYTLKSTDTTVNLTATSLAAWINSQTFANGGYTATATTDTVVITARPGLGKALNTGTNLICIPVSSGLTVTLTQFSSGVGSVIDVYHYHISEFFTQNQGGVLWVGIYAIPGTFDGNELNLLQNSSGGEIKQCWVYVDQHAFSSTDINHLNTVATALDANHMPVSVFYAADISGVSDLSTLADMSALTAEYVTPIIGQDGAAMGFNLFKAYGKSITNVGAFTGCVSVGKVSQSVANPSQIFNISDGTENEVAAFANGALYQTLFATNPNLITQLDNYSYVFVRKFVGPTGTWFSGEWTCIAKNSNYCHVSDNRVISKMERLLYPAYLPVILQGEVQLNSDGTIYFPVVKSLESTGDNALAVMGTNNEISAIATKVDPTQNLRTSSVFNIAVNYIQNFIARSVVISINKVTSLS